MASQVCTARTAEEHHTSSTRGTTVASHRPASAASRSPRSVRRRVVLGPHPAGRRLGVPHQDPSRREPSGPVAHAHHRAGSGRPTPRLPRWRTQRSGPSGGVLCVIGGAEDRVGDRVVLRELVRLAGGDGARIAVVATASSLGPEILGAYDGTFRDLGAGDVVGLRPESRSDADDPALVARLADVDAVFMTGGNQLKLASVVGGTAFGAAIIAAYARGAVVAGTSAGASAVSEHMLAFGDDATSPRQGLTTPSAAGLGLLPDVVVDQHFAQRNRYARLLSVVARSPRLLGIGVDEDTAAVVHGGRQLEVVGARLRLRRRRVARGQRRPPRRARCSHAGVRRRRAHAAGGCPVRPGGAPARVVRRGAPGGTAPAPDRGGLSAR